MTPSPHDPRETVWFRLKKSMGGWDDIYGAFKSGAKVIEYRDNTDHWRSQLFNADGTPKTRAYLTFAYPRFNAPRLEADIVQIVEDVESSQFLIHVENVVEVEALDISLQTLSYLWHDPKSSNKFSALLQNYNTLFRFLKRIKKLPAEQRRKARPGYNRLRGEVIEDLNFLITFYANDERLTKILRDGIRVLEAT